MAFDEGLGERIRDLFVGAPDVSERRMFGGLVFLVAGNMARGIRGGDLLVRVERGDDEATLELPHARPMEMGGRTMQGFVAVEGEGVAEDGDLSTWVDRGVAVARSRPPK